MTSSQVTFRHFAMEAVYITRCFALGVEIVFLFPEIVFLFPVCFASAKAPPGGSPVARSGCPRVLAIKHLQPSITRPSVGWPQAFRGNLHVINQGHATADPAESSDLWL